MVRLYLDANVILDYLQDRENAPYIEKIFLKANNQEVQLLTSVINFATIFYFESRAGQSTSRIIERFKILNKIINPVSQTVASYYSSLKSGFNDFEDALQYFAAVESESDYILTNNIKDFKSSKIPVLTAKDCVQKIF